MNINAIKGEADYDAALQEIGSLLDAEEGSPEADRLEVLTALVSAYEQQHYPMPLPDPIEAIRCYMETRGLTRKDLEKCIGSRGRVSEILSRERPLTLAMIRRLSAQLGIPGDILIQPYALAPKATKQHPREEQAAPAA
ncbi:MAG TPA: transcriptional regulator [Armatimonadota bacterium]|jgi:HTH-type transcriptional regulator/antitoxin HigA